MRREKANAYSVNAYSVVVTREGEGFAKVERIDRT